MKQDLKHIKHIIFDLGGVLLNIDYTNTVAAFESLGLANPMQAFTKTKQAELFQEFEKGNISETDFLASLQGAMPQASKAQIEAAWNAMLGDFPKERFDFLKKVSGSVECFVLSNTNIIHQKAFETIIDKSVGWEAFSGIFSKVYYSHEMGMRKPDAEIFESVLAQNNLVPSQTCFIDDSPQHVATARNLGIYAIHLEDGSEIWDVLAD